MTLQSQSRSDPWGTVLYVRLVALLQRMSGLVSYLYRLRSALRSFRGHSAILLSTNLYPGVDFGPVFQEEEGGALSQCAMTYARSDGINKLMEKYPWADYVDWRVFLEGFDAGAEWGARNADKVTPKSARSPF